ncbi:hypothetical protein C8R48DRAFT_679267 [Suillus tomentosus]|nr:hypothetical protein C8R48DRAFT_679267 [Suillus tomentosus]
MSSHHVDFTPPLNATRPHTVATAGESHSVQMQQAHREWWGNFVPIADWEPPKICKSKFDGMKIQNYRISPEIDKPGDPECPYDRAFAGANDTVGKLTAMFNEEWVSKERAATPADTDVDMDVSYDLGWDSEPKVGGVNLEAGYDLGWDSAPDGGDYDLGWDSAPDGNDVPSGEVPQESVGVDLEASYDLGWEAPAVDALDSRCAMMASSHSTIDVDNAYDLGWDVVSEDQSCNPINIDEVYDLRWNDTATVDRVEDRHVQSDLIPLSSSSNSVGDEDSDASTGIMSSNAQPGASNHTPDVLHQAEAAMAHALRRLNAVGHTNDDEQMHCIVQTAVDSLGRSYAPSRRGEESGDRGGRRYSLNHLTATSLQWDNGSAGNFGEGP